MIPSNYIEYYGDDVRWFVGKVVNVGDPLFLDRVQVRIYGVHNESIDLIPTKDLPWAQVVIPTTEHGSSGYGSNSMLKPGAMVFGFFLDGKSSQLPLIIGSIPHYITEIVSDKKPETTTGLQPDNADTKKPNPRIENKYNVNADADILKGDSNIEKAFNHFISPAGGGYTEKQAAGIIGNLIVESGGYFNSATGEFVAAASGDIYPKAVGDNGNAFGIAQWNETKNAGYRVSLLKDFCSQNYMRFDSLYGQLNFITYEIASTPYYRNAEIKLSTDVETPTRLFAKFYENPANFEESVRTRISYAKKIYKDFSTGVA